MSPGSSDDSPQDRYILMFVLIFFLKVDSVPQCLFKNCSEVFTLATKTPKGKALQPAQLPPSRLEYQSRTNIVNVKAQDPAFRDEENKVYIRLHLVFFL